MLKYIIGKITMIEKDTIVIENNEIGYEIFVANSSEFPVENKTKVFLHNHIREDANLLFGFLTIQQLNLFEKLIQVKGIGPKIALNILKGEVNLVLEAIINNDEKFLTSFNGIGPKAAKQIILDLSNKLQSLDVKSTPLATFKVSEYNLAIETLQAIGISKSEIKSFEQQLKTMQSEAEMVKYVLANRGK